MNILTPFHECMYTKEAIGEEYRQFILSQFQRNEDSIKTVKLMHGLYSVTLEVEITDMSEFEYKQMKMLIREYRVALKALTEFEGIRLTDRAINAEYHAYMESVLILRRRERIQQKINQQRTQESSLRDLLELFLKLDPSSYQLKRVRRKGEQEIQYHLYVKPLAACRLGLPVNSGWHPIDHIIEQVNSCIVAVDPQTLNT